MRIALLLSKRGDMAQAYRNDWTGRNTYDDADAVTNALKELDHQVTKYFSDLDTFEKLKKQKEEIDLVFNLCDDGFFSNAQLEPHLPAMLDILGIPYTGSNYLSLALCLNKDVTKQLLACNGIPTPKFQVFNDEKDDLKKGLKFPLIVKPIHEDASIGITDKSIVKNEAELRERVEFVIEEYKQQALVEEFIDGKELDVAILGNEKEILPVLEILFENLPKDKAKILNYASKWDEKSVENKKIKRNCPANIGKKLEKRLTDIALQSSGVLSCQDYARVDFRVDKDGNPFVLEVNPNPDLSKDDFLAMMAKAKGYSYTELINRIIKSALQRNRVNVK